MADFGSAWTIDTFVERCKGERRGGSTCIGAGDLVIVRPEQVTSSPLMDTPSLPQVRCRQQPMPQMVPRLGSVAGDGEALIARGDQLHRAVEPARRDSDQRATLSERPARPEGAADERRDDMYLVRVDAELLGKAMLEPGDVLAWYLHIRRPPVRPRRSS